MSDSQHDPEAIADKFAGALESFGDEPRGRGPTWIAMVASSAREALANVVIARDYSQHGAFCVYVVGSRGARLFRTVSLSIDHAPGALAEITRSGLRLGGTFAC